MLNILDAKMVEAWDMNEKCYAININIKNVEIRVKMNHLTPIKVNIEQVTFECIRINWEFGKKCDKWEIFTFLAEGYIIWVI